MKDFWAKILLITITTVFLFSCNAVKRVPENKHLLKKNQIFVDSVKNKDVNLQNQLYQTPNAKLLGIPLRLHVYNLASINKDSLYQNWLNKKPKRKKRITKLLSSKQVHRLGIGLSSINEWLKSAGEAPVISDETKIKKSIDRLKSYYWNNGWFNVEADYKTHIEEDKTLTVDYYVQPKAPYLIKDLGTKIESNVADSIYHANTSASKIIKGNQYKTSDIEAERERITSLYRNSGLYHFEKEFIKFDADTINTNHGVNLNLLINNRTITKGESSTKVPFKIHNISKVNIYTDYSYENRNKSPQDTTFYRGYTIYGFDKIKYTRKSLTNAVLITPDEIYREQDRTFTSNQINNLRTFKYPNIRYEIDPKSPDGSDLIANILLTPKKKYSINAEFDVSTSSIQVFGIGFGGSLLLRNLFRGAEILEISGRGSIGSSSDAIDVGERFFNISEIGGDVKLSLPKLLFPVNTRSIIQKNMAPTTNLILGFNIQQNIGLDKQNATAEFNYQWRPNKTVTNQIDVINAQYVRNLNPENYFNIYTTSYNNLNEIARDVLDPDSFLFIQPESGELDIDDAALIIPEGTASFIAQALNRENTLDLTTNQINEIGSIDERRFRLTEDNLILASSYSFTKNSRENLYDEEYSRFNLKLEFAGNTLNTLSNLLNLEKNENNRFDILGVEFSQYAKIELDYIKHWDLQRKNIIAFRMYGGLAIPYDNSNSIPFSRSFFGGGPNDNRAWSVYDLGPGSTGGIDEFNEANMKIASNLEYRYNILGSLNGALFVDAGNIWNVLDNVEDEAAVFSGIQDLREIAVGTGIGLRYDFSFFVIRFDVGFKTYNPSNNEDNRWFKGYNFSEAVYHFGINYPF